MGLKTKYRVLAASILIQVCLGGVYAWSTFVPELHDGCGLSMAQTQILFGCLIATFTLAMIPAGRLVCRVGPRTMATIGGVLFLAGYLLAAASGGRFSLLLIGIGLLAGVGTGCCYVCPLVAGAAWFPSRPGLVTGLAVAGFGGGAVLLTVLGEWLLHRGFGVLRVFAVVGLVYGGAIIAAATVLQLPVAAGSRRRVARRFSSVRDPFFIRLLMGMFTGTFAGLLVIGNLKPMALWSSLGETVAVEAIAAFAVGNAAGRIVWGWLADRLGGRTPGLALAMLAAVTLTMLIGRRHAGVFLSTSLLVGFGFGACFVVYATLTASRYGAERLGELYPLLFLAYGLSGAVGPAVGGLLYDVTGGYGLGLGLCIILSTTGAVVLHRLPTPAGLGAHSS